MKVYDLKSKEQWQVILDKVSHDIEMTTGLADENNVIVQTCQQRTELCSIIRSVPESASYLCNKSQLALAGEAKHDRKPVVELCEAGLCKFVVPLFNGDEFIGSITACGSCFSKDDVDSFVISKNTKLDEKNISQMISFISEIKEESLNEFADKLFREFN